MWEAQYRHRTAINEKKKSDGWNADCAKKFKIERIKRRVHNDNRMNLGSRGFEEPRFALEWRSKRFPHETFKTISSMILLQRIFHLPTKGFDCDVVFSITKELKVILLLTGGEIRFIKCAARIIVLPLNLVFERRFGVI